MTSMLMAVAMLAVPQDAKQELDDLRKKVEALERRLDAQETEAPPSLEAPARNPRGDVSGLYSKPFMARFGGNVALGGYIDLEYIHTRQTNKDTFDAHRFVPFVYADVSENIKVMAEMEIEHGTGISLEFAHMDYLISEPVNFRAGIILDPLGNFNLVHDAPYQDLAIRPLVDTLVIPAVLREPGAGFFGTIDLDPWVFEYEAYLVNGFKGLDRNGVTVVTETKGLRDARPHTSALGSKSYRDLNNEPAGVGRVSVSPFLGLEVGGSAYVGDYDENGNNLLALWAVDWTVDFGGVASAVGLDPEFWGRFEMVGEYAAANFYRDTFAWSAGVPSRMDGLYVEGRFHVMPAFLRDVIPGANPESTFTLVYRYGMVEIGRVEQSENAAGINFRLREDTVFKFEYIWRDEIDGMVTDIDNDQFVASVATYF